jgi:acetyltransferase
MSNSIVPDSLAALTSSSMSTTQCDPTAERLATRSSTVIVLDDGTTISVRPVRPDDEPHMAVLHGHLSDQTVRFRYFANTPLHTRIDHARLKRICHPDLDQDIVLVAEHRLPHRKTELIGVARLDRQADPKVGEIALLVVDHWQRHTLGAHLFDLMIAIAKQEKLGRIFITFHRENRLMRLLCDHRGFITSQPVDETFTRSDLRL